MLRQLNETARHGLAGRAEPRPERPDWTIVLDRGQTQAALFVQQLFCAGHIQPPPSEILQACPQIVGNRHGAPRLQ